MSNPLLEAAGVDSYEEFQELDDDEQERAAVMAMRDIEPEKLDLEVGERKEVADGLIIRKTENGLAFETLEI